jgi:hypothetical protein
MMPQWTQRADGSWTWAGYSITMRCTRRGVGWIISRAGRQANALLCPSLQAAMRLAEWDGGVSRTYSSRT